MDSKGKHKVIATYLALFLGWIGAHHFYLGSWGTGLIYLLVSVVGFCFGGTLFILGIGWIDAICLIQMDSETFDRNYNDRKPRPLETIFRPKKYRREKKGTTESIQNDS